MKETNIEPIITNINDDLAKALDPIKRDFYNKLNGKKKDYFLYMSDDDQKTLMKGGLDPEEEHLMWEYASTLALRILNKGFGLSERARAIGKIGRVSLTLALIAGLSGIVTSTYLKNHKIQSLIKVTAETSEEVPFAINANQNELVKSESLMTPGDFLVSSGAGCTPMSDIADSFYQASGKPFCKSANGKIWIGGYVRTENNYGERSQAVLLMIEGGKLTNIEFKGSEKNPFQGIESVPLVKVEKALKDAFNKNNKGDKHE